MRQQVNLVARGETHFGTDTRLLFAHFVDTFCNVVHPLFVNEHFLGSSTLHQVVNLHDGDVIGFAKEEGDGLEQGVVGALHLWVAANDVCNEHGSFELVGPIGAKRHAL